MYLNVIKKLKIEKKMSKYTDGKHAKHKLREIMKFAKMLHEFIDGHENLPEWIMDKFAVSANDLNESYQYLENKRIERLIGEVVREEISKIDKFS